MKKRVVATIFVAAIAPFAITATALATMASGVTSTTLAQGNVEDIDVRVKTDAWKVQLDTKGPTTMATTENRVAPAGSSAGTAILGRVW